MKDRNTSEDGIGGRWARASFFWLMIAALLMIFKALALNGGEGTIAMLPFGRAFLAAKGAFIYGWAFSALMGAVFASFPLQQKLSGWHRLFWSLWQIGVGLGVVSVLIGQSSGIVAMPFAYWVIPMLAVVLGGLAVAGLMSASGGRSYYTSFIQILMAASLILLLAYGDQGVAGMMFSKMLESVIYLSFPCLGVIMACQYAAGQHPEVQSLPVYRAVRILPYAVLFWLPLAGVAELEAWPIPWMFISPGQWAMGTILALLAAGCWECVIRIGKQKSKPEYSGCLLIGSGLLFVCVLLKAYIVFWPDETLGGQFAWVKWHADDVLLWAGVGLLMVPLFAGERMKRAMWSWVTVCVIAFLVTALSSYAYIRQGEIALGPEQQVKWVSLVSWVEAVFAVIVVAVAVFVFFGIGKHAFRETREGKCLTASAAGFLRRLFAVVMAVTVLMYGGVVFQIGHFIGEEQGESVFVSLRPGKNAVGAAVYAAEGCAICHTQMQRRLLSGDDVQSQINLGKQGDTVYRPSEPQDYDLEMGEGAAHAGFTRIGPDLFNLSPRAAEYVSYTNKEGEVVQNATPYEWLMLHLYNPREEMFGKTWSLCPSMTGLFEKKRVAAGVPSKDALPLAVEPGYEIVPTQRAVHLVNYLLTLKRASNPEEDNGKMLSTEGNHISPKYEQHAPRYDFSPIEQARTKAVMEKGKQLFLAKCAICHGADGQGDQVNYPPLDGSEWLTEKDPSVLADVIRNGLSEPITVKGREWNSTMFPPGITNSRELSSVMTYLIRRFGKRDIPPVSLPQAEEWWRAAGEKKAADDQ